MGQLVGGTSASSSATTGGSSDFYWHCKQSGAVDQLIAMYNIAEVTPGVQSSSNLQDALYISGVGVSPLETCVRPGYYGGFGVMPPYANTGYNTYSFAIGGSRQYTGAYPGSTAINGASNYPIPRAKTTPLIRADGYPLTSARYRMQGILSPQGSEWTGLSNPSIRTSTMGITRNNVGPGGANNLVSVVYDYVSSTGVYRISVYARGQAVQTVLTTTASTIMYVNLDVTHTNGAVAWTVVLTPQGGTATAYTGSDTNAFHSFTNAVATGFGMGLYSSSNSNFSGQYSYFTPSPINAAFMAQVDIT